MESINPESTIYAESHYISETDSYGAYNLKIGNGSNLFGTFSSINWGQGSRYLKIEIDPNGGTNYTINVGNTQLLSVPYSFLAKDVINGIQTINNLIQLRELNALVENKVVYIKGHTSEGDGGEGFFIYKLNEERADNYGVIIKPNSIAENNNGRWVRQYSGYLNINYFGVKKDWPPAGVSYSDRIQKAIDYATSGGIYGVTSNMTLYFPNGEYFIDKPIIIKNNIVLTGESGTLLTLFPGSNYDYMFKMTSGPIARFSMENFMINLNHTSGVGAMNFKASGNSTGGLWGGVFKNIEIMNLKGNGLYLEGDTGQVQSTDLPNQFLIFENFRVVREDNNFNSLKITGQNGQLTFLNCSFEAKNNKGTNILISKNNIADEGSAVISFINTTIQSSEYGVKLDYAENITFDNCWFETLDVAMNIYSSKGINVLNSRFANAAGFGTLDIPNANPSGTGKCINIENSFVNIGNNYVAVSNPRSNLSKIQGEKFIAAGGNNNVINAFNNSFQDILLSETFGIMQIININSQKIDLSSKKLVFVTVPTGSTNNIINRIDSTISAGEIIFIRANQGSITFNQMSNSETTGKNIFLNGRTSLTLVNGQAATFIKIDNIVGNEKATYQLLSIAD